MSARAQMHLIPDRPPNAVTGLTYVGDAVTPGDERALAAYAEHLNFKPFEFRGFTGNRRTVSFGWRYDFKGGGFQRAEPMPPELDRARAIVAERLGERALDFEQCSVLEYAPGAGIGWHQDRPQFGKVAGLSLLAPCRFRFRQKLAEGRWAREAVELERRSAYLLDGEARRLWQHSISPMDALRYSITFRTLAR